MDNPKIDSYLSNEAGSVCSVCSQNTIQELEWPLRKIEVTAISEQAQIEPDPGIRIWDIISHYDSKTTTETMVNLLKMYPDVHERTRRAWETSTFETANSLTLGVPRKIRQSKVKSPKKSRSTNFPHNEILTLAAKANKSNPLKPKFESAVRFMKPEIAEPKKDHSQQKFPKRKVCRTTYKQKPVDCDCRQDPRKDKGPLLAVKGTQLALFDRECIMCK